MKTIFKILTLFFALVGFALTLVVTLDCINNDKMARKFLENCPNVKNGMNLNEARSILGEFDENYFFIYEKKPEFYFIATDSLGARYFLEYPCVDDECVTLEFDPFTNKIVAARCGGPY